MLDHLFDDLRQLRLDRDRANAEFDRHEAEVINLLRSKGYTWDQIGRELGVTRQSAWERYGHQVEE